MKAPTFMCSAWASRANSFSSLSLSRIEKTCDLAKRTSVRTSSIESMSSRLRGRGLSGISGSSFTKEECSFGLVRRPAGDESAVPLVVYGLDHESQQPTLPVAPDHEAALGILGIPKRPELPGFNHVNGSGDGKTRLPQFVISRVRLLEPPNIGHSLAS